MPTTYDILLLNASNMSVCRPENISDIERSEEIIDTFVPLVIVFSRYCLLVWFVVGLVGNIIATKVWLLRRMIKFGSSIYLAVISLSDVIFLVLNIASELHHNWRVPVLRHSVLCEMSVALRMMPQYVKPLLILGITVERFLSIYYPLQREVWCRRSRSVKVICGMMVLSILLGLPWSYIWTFDSASGECTYRLTNTTTQYSFPVVYTWTTEILIFVTVPLVTLIVNIFVIYKLRRLDKDPVMGLFARRHSKSNCRAPTLTLLWVSFYYILTQLSITLVFTFEHVIPPGRVDMCNAEVERDPTWQRYFTYFTVRKLTEVTCFSHYACNVFIYCATAKDFRREVVTLLKSTLKYCPFKKSVPEKSTSVQMKDYTNRTTSRR